MTTFTNTLRYLCGPDVAECVMVNALTIGGIVRRREIAVDKPSKRCIHCSPQLLVLFPLSGVHPKTGRVCVPIDPDRADDFDPATVPTVRSLAAQVQNASFQHNFLVLINLLLWQQLDANGSDASKTDMKEAMDLFAKTFGRSLETSNRCEHCDKSLHCFLLIYTTSSEKSSAKEEIDCSSFNTE